VVAEHAASTCCICLKVPVNAAARCVRSSFDNYLVILAAWCGESLQELADDSHKVAVCVK
jgi:hypothetical protein